MTPTPPASRSARSLLIETLRPYLPAMVGGCVLILLAAGLALTWPWVLRQAIDGLVAGGPEAGERLPWLALAIVGLAALEAASRFGARYVIIAVSRQAEFDLRERLFARLLVLDAPFYHRYRIGDLMARATNDLSAVRQLLGPGIQLLFSTVVLLTAALILMAGISPKLAAGAALLLPSISLLFGVFRGRIEARFTRVQAQYAALNAQAEENLSGIRVVKAYAQEQAEVEAFRSASEDYLKRSLEQVRLSGLLWPMMGILSGLATVMLLYVGGRDVIQGELTLGQYVQFGTYLGQLGWPMIALGWVMNLIQQGIASLHRVQELLAVEPAIRDAPAAEAPPPIAPGAGVAVSFEQVDLELGGRPVLEGISFELPPGGFLGVVGPTGSGKSALLALLARVYDPTAGRVLLDGRDIRDWPLAELRRQVGYAPQETLLFSTALRENVAFGLEEVDEAALQRAVSIARLEQDLPQLVDGIDTVVGERGVTLSGGQKQRTAIARALLKDPCLLVLDDALASVDADTEVAILAGLREAMRERTSVVASHRLTAVREADLILVLDGGRVLERGTHAELLAQEGLYARLWRRQQLSEALEHADGQARNGQATNGQAASHNGVARARPARGGEG